MQPRKARPRAAFLLPKNNSQGAGVAPIPGIQRDPRGFIVRSILRPEIPPSDALLLSLAAGLAVRAAVTEVTATARRSEMAERSAARQQEILRHSHRDECRAHSRSPSRSGRRHQR